MLRCMDMAKDRERYVLLTNIDYVVVGPVRTMTHALLLEEFHDFLTGGLRRRIRGFGPDPAWPVFDMESPSIEFTLTDAKGRDIFIGNDGEEKPLISGAILQVEGGPRLELWVSDPKWPIRVDEFEGHSEERPILRVWVVLPLRVASFWNAPNMPNLVWGPSPREKMQVGGA